eukprot:6173311-Pleurochrysis_carterae.AAC.2
MCSAPVVFYFSIQVCIDVAVFYFSLSRDSKRVMRSWLRRSRSHFIAKTAREAERVLKNCASSATSTE